MTDQQQAHKRGHSSSLRFKYRTSAGVFGDEAVDGWELKAARRALKNLKTLLHAEPMRELLRDQIEAADRRCKEIVAASKGEFRECRTDINVEGFSATQMMQGMSLVMQLAAQGGKAMDEYLINFGYPMHPEHYVAPPYQGIGIVETLGGMPTRMRVVPLQLKDLPAFVQALAEESYPYKSGARAELDDGTVWAWLLHEFRDTDTGSDLILRVLWPAAAPEAYFDDHSEHFAIEFRNIIKSLASEALEGGTA
jgi:hypothetical protein